MVVADRLAHHLDLTLLARYEADDGPHQDRFAADGGADQAKDLATAHVEVKMIDHDMAAESDQEIMYADRKLSVRFLHRYIPIDAKNTANSPSSTITRKIDFTTEVVVCLPSDSALPLTRRPSLQATTPITSAMNGALMIPTSK